MVNFLFLSIAVIFGVTINIKKVDFVEAEDQNLFIRQDAQPLRNLLRKNEKSDCRDMLQKDGKEWRMPDENIWRDTQFVDKTCDDLQNMVKPNQYKLMCTFLSQGITSSLCPKEACCFCNGGTEGDVETPLAESWCVDLEWTALGQNLDCAFIEKTTDPDSFCTAFKDDAFSKEGLTLSEACCVCGGGTYTHYEEETEDNRKRRLQTEETRSSKSFDELVEPADLRYKERKLNVEPVPPYISTATGASTKIDHTVRQGLGDSPGVPNMEFLGLGYHSLEGNPRGAENSELDPGFRYRILQLRLEQSKLTVDQDLMVPIGTELKYTSTCKFDSKSTKIETESDLRASLSREAQFDSSISHRTRTSSSSLFHSSSTSTEFGMSFSKSSKYKSTRETSSSVNNVFFESRAVCSEYEASFSPYAEQELDPIFKQALIKLPVPFDAGNLLHVLAYGKFIETYGTHYVKYLVLGGKRILSTEMSSQDFNSLVNEEVDVSSTLTYEMSSAMSASAGVKAGLVKAAASAASKFGGPKGKAIGTIVNVALEGTDDDTTLFGGGVDTASSYSLSMFSSTKKQAEAAMKISKKSTTTSEVTVGGLPSSDWREWAATVKERPMPILYKLGSIIDFMSYEKAVSFSEAFTNIYKIDSKYSDRRGVPPGYFFGVLEGSGEPKSKYSTDPNTHFRATMTVDKSQTSFTPKRKKGSNKTVEVISYSPVWRGKIGRPTPIFATPINGVVGKRSIEEKSPFWFGLELDYYEYIPFAFCKDTRSPCKLAMTNYGTNTTDADDDAFSFLAVALPVETKNSSRLITGIVGFDSIILNDHDGNPGFSVSEEVDDVGEYFLVTLDIDASQKPTVIITPRIDDLDYPGTVREVSLYIDGTSRKEENLLEFIVRSSTFTGNLSEITPTINHTHVGFNFLAVSQVQDELAIKHGFINGVPGAIEGNHILYGIISVDLEFDDVYANFNNITVDAIKTVRRIQTCHQSEFSYYECFKTDDIFNSESVSFEMQTTTVTAMRGGVRVHFEDHFSDIPSVIVTPVFTEESQCQQKISAIRISNTTEEVHKEDIMQCRVETITTEEVFVKCACIREIILIEEYNEYIYTILQRVEIHPSPFNLVAVGPTN